MQATTNPITTREPASSPLDDPVDFAHELYNKLWSGFGNKEIPVDAALGTALETYDQTKDQIVALLADHPEAPATRRHLERLGELCISIAQDQHDLGTEFGVASEQLRRTLLAGMTGPHQRSWHSE
jgi:hypothetical protein